MRACSNCGLPTAKDHHEMCQACNKAYLAGRNESVGKAKALLSKAAEYERERILTLIMAKALGIADGTYDASTVLKNIITELAVK